MKKIKRAQVYQQKGPFCFIKCRFGLLNASLTTRNEKSPILLKFFKVSDSLVVLCLVNFSFPVVEP